MLFSGQFCMSCYVLYRHALLFSFTHCRWHSVVSVFYCEDFFLHWSSSFTGVNCWSHPIFYGANYSSHHISSFLTGVNCLSHPIFYGANCSSHHVVSFFTGVNGLSHPIVYGATVQATIIFSSAVGVNCFNHLIFYAANCSSHHVLSFFAGVNCLSHPVSSMVLTVQATMFLAFLRVLTV